MTEFHSPDVQVGSIGPETLVLRSRTWERLKFEVEYARQKGTTANSYLIQARDTALLDPPGESFTSLFLEELQQHQYPQRLTYIILNHVNPNRVATLKALLVVAPYTSVICSRPGAVALRAAFANHPLESNLLREEEALDLGIQVDEERTLELHVVRDEEVLDLGEGHELQFRFVPTPRHPDALAVYDPKSRILFTDKLFGAHVCGESILDEHWRALEEDRRYYFDCLHAIQATQVEAALTKLQSFAATTFAPAHGPLIRHSLSRLVLDYQTWCQEQQSRDVRVTLLYTSAYGNTGQLARALEKGIQQSGGQVKSLDCELEDPSHITQAIEWCDGFVVGSPTLGGQAPTQIQTALGMILSTATSTKLAGVFGSYGWSGEAVDLLETKLRDAGYSFGFAPIRVKFKPTPTDLQQCETAAAEFVQTLKKAKRSRPLHQTLSNVQVDRTSQAIGRVTGSLCVITAQSPSGSDLVLATSWVAQASFNPPGLSIAIPKHHPLESLGQAGQPFVLNILQEGKQLNRQILRSAQPGRVLTEHMETHRAHNGGLILSEVLAYLECTVQQTMDCGDHWLLYTSVDQGKVLDASGVTAVNYGKLGQRTPTPV